MKLKLISRYYFYQFVLFLPLVLFIHYVKHNFVSSGRREYDQSVIAVFPSDKEPTCKCRHYEIALLEKELYDLREEIDAINAWRAEIAAEFNENVQNALDTFYTDQIGMFDYASESCGGSILSTPDTMSYPTKHSVRLFGTISWIVMSEPKSVIQAAHQPEECFAFYGSRGRIRVKLGQPVVVSQVSLEHLNARKSSNGVAPRQFEVFGLDEYFNEFSLGNFTYNVFGRVIQTFDALQLNKTFPMVELRILNNYGNNEFTCVYRFRVHSNF